MNIILSLIISAAIILVIFYIARFILGLAMWVVIGIVWAIVELIKWINEKVEGI